LPLDVDAAKQATKSEAAISYELYRTCVNGIQADDATGHHIEGSRLNFRGGLIFQLPSLREETPNSTKHGAYLLGAGSVSRERESSMLSHFASSTKKSAEGGTVKCASDANSFDPYG